MVYQVNSSIMVREQAGRNPDVRTPPTFRYNHPKNYFGVPIAIAAPGDAGGLIAAYIVRGAGAARQGAEQLQLITADETLTHSGQRVVDHAETAYRDLRTALEQFAEWQGTTTRFIELDDGVWAEIAPEIVVQHPVVADLVRLLDTAETPLTLPELTHTYLQAAPETARQVFVRESFDYPDTAAESADALYEAEVYRSAVTCQLKTIMYHAGLVTEPGADSSHLIPEIDVWEPTQTALSLVETSEQKQAVTGSRGDGQ